MRKFGTNPRLQNGLRNDQKVFCKGALTLLPKKYHHYLNSICRILPEFIRAIQVFIHFKKGSFRFLAFIFSVRLNSSNFKLTFVITSFSFMFIAV